MSSKTKQAPRTQPGSGQARSRRGEKTRQKILEACLQVIADKGVEGVTHRAVAAAADVQTSLTTYYFKDIGDLVGRAFEHFCARGRDEIQQLWGQIDSRLEELEAGSIDRLEFVDWLCTVTEDYIAEQVEARPLGLAVEQTFFHQVRLEGRYRRMAEAHREELIAPIRRLCTRLGSEDAEVDAQLLLNTITGLEYDALAAGGQQLDHDRVRRIMRRQVSALLGAA